MSNPFSAPSQPTVVQQAAPKPPALMPDQNSPAVLEARRKAMSDMMARAGRQSTILTAPGQRGGNSGGDSYSSNTLGSST